MFWGNIMLLTAEMYQQIIKALKSDPRAVQDRRRFPRVGMRAKISIVPLNSQRQPMPPEDVWVRDVSAGGFGLLARTKLQTGQLFIIRLERRDDEPLSLLCEVAKRYPNDYVGSKILKTLNAKNDEQEVPPAGDQITPAASARKQSAA
jgi:hypothetical protein